MTAIDGNPAAERDAPQRVSFYFSAHQDDWQLFMNPSAFCDVLDGNTKCVFIHMTAGDAGFGTGSGGRKHPLYLARKNGAESAIRFMADSNNRPPVEKVASTMAVDGHPIHRVSYRNTVAYFLRVPDGSPAGTGYADTGYQSLQRLADGQNDTLSAIDGTTAYHGWNDLVRRRPHSMPLWVSRGCGGCRRFGVRSSDRLAALRSELRWAQLLPR